MKKILIIAFFAVLIPMINSSCTEPYALQTNNFDDAIVVEATITNEFKKQEIKISRTYRFEENGPKFETGAIVYIKDDLGNTYDFEENNGKYISTSEFQAVANRNYHLSITTNDGKTYDSTNEKLTTVSPIQDLVPEVVTKEGVRGVQIVAKSFDPTNTSKYYRYEYEETSRISVPKWSYEYLTLDYDTLICGYYPDVKRVLKGNEIGKVCYKTENSKDIILTSTNNLSEDRVNYPVRFIKQSDYTIAERYSILVTQYVQSFDTFSFYTTLKKISGSGSILSQNQPGFIYGNIKLTSNPNEKVIGFFNVSSVSKKRIFFNYEDLFPGEPTPKYFNECYEHEFCKIRYREFLGTPNEGPCFSEIPICVEPLYADGPGRLLLDLVNNKQLIYYKGSFSDYVMVEPICGDCSQVGANLKPIFWID